ncbi:MAG TPA: FAD-dependent oxidoreductase [Bacillota bacterium]|nr:FAD-dependent oxidoreductase [Bacillota bacterium]
MEGQPPSICVIGAGLTGLVCARKLALSGWLVNVVEQHSTSGGMLASVRMGHEYIELLPHHIRRSDRYLLSLLKELGLQDEVQWYDSRWYGKARATKLGYLDTGFHSLTSALAQEITDHGGIIHYGYTVVEIAHNKELGRPRYSVNCVLADTTTISLECDIILYTGACRNLAHISHNLNLPTDFRDSLMDVTYKANMCLLMVMRQSFTGCFSRIIESEQPFQRMIQHTNLVGERRYGGHVLYLSGSFATSMPLWTASDADVFKAFYKELQRINPAITRSDIRTWRLTRTRYALPTTHARDELIMPVEGLYVCSLAMAKTDNNTNEYRMDPCIALANSTSARIKEDLTHEENAIIE